MGRDKELGKGGLKTQLFPSQVPLWVDATKSTVTDEWDIVGVQQKFPETMDLDATSKFVCVCVLGGTTEGQRQQDSPEVVLMSQSMVN